MEPGHKTEAKHFHIDKSFCDDACEPGDYRDDEIKGFLLRVRKTDNRLSRTFLVHAKCNGILVSVTIGPYGKKEGGYTAAKARDEAASIKLELRSGINRNEQEKAERHQATVRKAREEKENRRKTLTLRQVFEEYLSAKDLKESTRYAYKNVIKTGIGTKECNWLDKPIVDITKDMVQQRHRELGSKHKGDADHTMRVLRALFQYAIAGYEDENGQPLVTVNPVSRLKERKLWHRPKRREDYIKDSELPEWWAAVQSIEDGTARDFLIFLLLTGLRLNEAAGLKWRRGVDLHEKTFKVFDTKNHTAHELPLSNYLYRMLLRRYGERTTDDVFPSAVSKARYHMEMMIPLEERRTTNKLRRTAGKQTSRTFRHFMAHSLRRTFLTTAAKLDISAYAIKQLANHAITGDVTAGYVQRDPAKLSDAMQKITDHVIEKAGVKERDAEVFHLAAMASSY